MKRHFDSQHKGKDVKYKLVADGCRSLMDPTSWTKKNSGEQVLGDENSEGKDGDDDKEDMQIEDGVVERGEGMDLGDAGADSTKRNFQDFESDEEDENMNTRKKSKGSLVELLLEKISNMEGHMNNIDKKSGHYQRGD